MARSPGDVPDATMRLLLARGLGPLTLRRLRDRFDGDDERIAAATAGRLRRVGGLSEKVSSSIRDAIAATDPQRERRAMAAAGATLVLAGDDDYPPLLAAIGDAPPALWVRGALTRADRLAIAIVGSRRCTAYGREQAGRFASVLGECGFTIVSGGALGIDAAAHRGALRAGARTIAVLGCGLARCYPPDHAPLFDQLLASGSVLLSEHPMEVPPLAQHFPRRNRVISGLVVGVLVAEAGRRSGALITARHAAEDHGREVMIVPGRIDTPTARGGLEAARDGWGALVLDHLDVLRQLEAAGQLVRGALESAGVVGRGARDLSAIALSPRQQAIFDAIASGSRPLCADAITACTRLPIEAVLAELTMLEIRGCVRRELDGRGWVRAR